VRPDSRSVVFMPSHDFHFTEEDTADLIAFFRALPPVDRDIPAPHVGIMARALSGTAASSEALEMGRRARPLAELAWRQVERLQS